MALDFGFFL